METSRVFGRVLSATLLATILVASIFTVLPVEKAQADDLIPLGDLADFSVGNGVTDAKDVMLFDLLPFGGGGVLAIDTNIETMPPAETDVDGDCTVYIEFQSKRAVGEPWVDVPLSPAFIETDTDHARNIAGALRLHVELRDAGTGANGCMVDFKPGNYVDLTELRELDTELEADAKFEGDTDVDDSFMDFIDENGDLIVPNGGSDSKRIMLNDGLPFPAGSILSIDTNIETMPPTETDVGNDCSTDVKIQSKRAVGEPWIDVPLMIDFSETDTDHARNIAGALSLFIEVIDSGTGGSSCSLDFGPMNYITVTGSSAEGIPLGDLADFSVGNGVTDAKDVMLFDLLPFGGGGVLAIDTNIETMPPAETDVDGDCTVYIEFQSKRAVGEPWVDVPLSPAFIETDTDHARNIAGALRLHVELRDAGTIAGSGCMVDFKPENYVDLTDLDLDIDCSITGEEEVRFRADCDGDTDVDVDIDDIGDFSVPSGGTDSKRIMLFDLLPFGIGGPLVIDTNILSNPPAETDADTNCTPTIEIQSKRAVGEPWVDVPLMMDFSETDTDHARNIAGAVSLLIELSDAGGANGCMVDFPSFSYINITELIELDIDCSDSDSSEGDVELEGDTDTCGDTEAVGPFD